ncbi:aspartyl protease [Chlorogloeopsis sp. ULAP01]|uniref:aspartyl protease n=1 Tax=Chlorogloeopsis sp. ULAP01 TaxID=3056483 RepID=UPI0025AABDAD|nr:aspartyl protease [Chlorogloeopsis sp. ULAP01]MDM9379630.1 aspartyl protease [Chlorogloeopsis sp. ULAP01]
MISGKFGDEDELLFEIELIAADGLELPVDAMLDTGFSYWLAIDNQDIEPLDWVHLERQTLLTARGGFDFDIYAGQVKIDGQEFDIPVHVGQELPEVLLGRQWLKTRRLVVDMASGVLMFGG